MLESVFNVNPENYNYRTYVWGNITRIIPKEVYSGGYDELSFEGRMLRVPVDYKRYLEIVYGNYMELPPEEKRYGHYKNVIIDLENSYEKYMLV